MRQIYEAPPTLNTTPAQHAIEQAAVQADDRAHLDRFRTPRPKAKDDPVRFAEVCEKVGRIIERRETLAKQLILIMRQQESLRRHRVAATNEMIDLLYEGQSVAGVPDYADVIRAIYGKEWSGQQFSYPENSAVDEFYALQKKEREPHES